MVQAMSFNSNPYINSSYPSPAQLGAYAGSRIPEMTSENNEDTFSSAVTTGTIGGATLVSIPYIIRPKEAWAGIKKANEAFKALTTHPGFTKLSPAEKLELFKNILKKERLAIRIGNVSSEIRATDESKKIVQALNKAQKNYQNAVLGAKNKAAQYAAEMDSIIANGTKKNWFMRLLSGFKTPKTYNAEYVTKNAENAGKAAASAAQTAGNVAKSTGITNFLKSAFKAHGAGGMAIFSSLFELFEVIPAFKSGTSQGIKQLGKSAVTVAADTAGFCVGSAVAGIAGAKIGAAIGTAVCPVLGTAIGGLIGLAGGMIGSWGARKLAKSVVGKSENEIAKEKETQQQAQQPQIAQTNYSPNFAGATNPFAPNPFTPNFGGPMLTGIFDTPTDSLGYYC